jgi:hypothetical protein
MGDYAVRMQFDIDADADQVTRVLTTSEGVRGWWSTQVDGDPGEAGAQFRVSFPDVAQPFEFEVERDDEQAVGWRTLDFPPWWADTTIRWRLAGREAEPGTQLQFAHEGFEPDDPVIPIITPAWAQIILRLKQYAETGAPTPFFDL